MASQKPSSSNDYCGYNLYSDGYIEQWGYYSGQLGSGNDSSKTFTYPIKMADAYYALNVTCAYTDVASQNGKQSLTSKTTTSFTYRGISLAGSARFNRLSWQLQGYAAQTPEQAINRFIMI